MPNLKELRSSIANAQSTGRITSAMKMVAAAKLKRAEEEANAARPYAELMQNMMSALAASTNDGRFPLLSGNGKDDTHLLVVMTSDRGLCGGFNSTLLRDIRRRSEDLRKQGKTVKLLVVGRKGVMSLRRDMRDSITASYEEIAKPAPEFAAANRIAQEIANRFSNDEFDVCTVLYNKFVSALTQQVTPLQLIPFVSPNANAANDNNPSDKDSDTNSSGDSSAQYEFEPSEEKILGQLLPRNLSVQIFRCMLESFASEQGARMTAMDSATRNVGDMINTLTISYNRTRQAQITKELIEIISGAEAL